VCLFDTRWSVWCFCLILGGVFGVFVWYQVECLVYLFDTRSPVSNRLWYGLKHWKMLASGSCLLAGYVPLLRCINGVYGYIVFFVVVVFCSWDWKIIWCPSLFRGFEYVYLWILEPVMCARRVSYFWHPLMSSDVTEFNRGKHLHLFVHCSKPEQGRSLSLETDRLFYPEPGNSFESERGRGQFGTHESFTSLDSPRHARTHKHRELLQCRFCIFYHTQR
jgi:hypothetical protein